jgi:hypothetical protein
MIKTPAFHVLYIISGATSPTIWSRYAYANSKLLIVHCRIVFTVNEHENICIAGLNRRAGYATVYY